MLIVNWVFGEKRSKYEPTPAWWSEHTRAHIVRSAYREGWARFPLIRLVARSRWLLLLERPSLFRRMWWWLVLLPVRLVQLVCTVAIWALLFIPRVRPNQNQNTQSITH